MRTTSRLILCLALLAVAPGCASTRGPSDLPEVETRPDLVAALGSLGYEVRAVSAAFFTGSPDPVAAYEIQQADGRRFTVLAFAPEDYELLRNNTSLDMRPTTGITPGRELQHRPPPANSRTRTRAKIFRKGAVVVVFGEAQTDLYYDLEQLLGRPTF